MLKTDLTANPVACHGYPDWGPPDGSGIDEDDFPTEPYCKFAKHIQKLGAGAYIATLTNNQRFSED